ncbi:MAG: amidohydrolase [Rhodothermales bacterium]
MTRSPLALALLVLMATSCQPRPAAPLSDTYAVVNARIWTAAPAAPWAEAMRIERGVVAAIGSRQEVLDGLDAGIALMDAHGAFLAPGFIDSHVHFLEGGMRLASVQLRDADSPEDFARRIADYAATLEAGTWILGGDWDHENWGGALPERAWIDAITPDHPVWVSRLDGHMALANTRALEAAGVTAATADVFGGEIVRDDAGNPTGLLKDNAMNLVWRVVPDPSPAQLDRALEAAMAYVNAQGVTGVYNMGTMQDVDVFERARDAGRLTTRIYAATPLAAWPALAERVASRGRGDDWVRIGGLKGFVDGSLGSHTAAFFEPFTDAPGDSGFFVESEDDLRRWIAGADSAGLQVMVHAIGDRAIHTLLNLFEDTASRHGPRDRRFRIEHAQHIAPADIPRFAALRVIASMQPYHAIDDGRWAERVIGPERSKTTYAFRSLIDAGAHVAFGSDWFVAPPTPLEGIYAAVTRRTLDEAHPGGWVPEQKIGVEEALAAYTREAAYAAFDEEQRGALRVGMSADFVLIDRDLTRIAPETLRDARIVKTVVGGKVVYEAPAP